MDYSRNYFSISVLTLFILTTVCSGAPQTSSQDVSKETKVVDKTDPLTTKEVPSSSLSTTAEGDIILTASGEATREQTLSSEDTAVVPSNTLPEGQVPESSLSTPGSKTELTSTSSDKRGTSAVSNKKTIPNGDSVPTSTSSAKSPSTSASGAEKPESSSSHKHNGGSAVVPLNSFGLFLIAFLSGAFLL